MRITIFCMMFLMGMATTASVSAQERGFYVGAGLGSVDMDFDDATITSGAGTTGPGSRIGIDFDRAAVVSVLAGYQWGRLALEAEFEHGLSEGDVEFGAAKGDFSYRNFKVQGVYRSAGRLYLMGKLGWSAPDLDVDLPRGRLGLGQSGFVMVGGGYRFTPSTSMEGGVGRSSHDTTSFTLGLLHRF